MQSRRIFFLFLAVLTAAALITGCGSSSKEAVTPAKGIVSNVTGTPVGLNNCTNCHTVQTAAWMLTKHANAANGVSSPGLPNIGAMGNPVCIPCHDPLGDSARLVAGYTGNVPRPVIGCESCHGGGANHNGSGPISRLDSNPGFTTIGGVLVSQQFQVCTSCHELETTVAGLPVNLLTANQASVETGTAGFTPVGTAVLTQSTITFRSGAAALQTDALAPGDGFFTDNTAVSANNTYNASVWLRGDVGGETVVLMLEELTAASASVASFPTTTITLPTTFTQYTVAGLFGATGVNARISVVAAAAPETFYADDLQLTQTAKPLSFHLVNAPTGSQNVITDTHFATPVGYSTANAHVPSALVNITGLAMDFNNKTVCTTCHDPHGTAGVNKDWAASLHGDTSKGHAWGLFNWSCDGTSVTTCGTSTNLATGLQDNNNRWLCQRCHTTTGLAAFADALAAGNTSLADGLIMGTQSKMTFTQNWLPERLQCNGCHSDNKGVVRKPGAFKAEYLYWPVLSAASGPAYDPVGNPSQLLIYARSSFQFPDLGTSNICVLCHSGRNNGQAVHNLNTAQALMTVDFSNLLFGDSHRFTSAATMFKAIGYEYVGRDYTDPASYRHNQIGTTAVPNTGTAGPCVGCHMFRASGTADHLMTAVSKASSTITGIASEVCFNCHQNSSAGLAKIADDERLAYAAAKLALTYFLGPNVVTGVTNTFAVQTASVPGTTNWLTPGDTDVTGNTTGKNNLGALFNARYLSFERGAYIHNSTYMKRLIYDSIDWLDDNQMNYSTGSSITTACTGTGQTWCALAKPYLLPNGVANGAPAERP